MTTNISPLKGRKIQPVPEPEASVVSMEEVPDPPLGRANRWSDLLVRIEKLGPKNAMRVATGSLKRGLYIRAALRTQAKKRGRFLSSIVPRMAPSSTSGSNPKEASEMRKLIFCSLLILSGCAYHPAPANVFGASGKQYTAPALCQALVQCKNAGEADCYYEADRQTDATGNSSDTYYCKDVKR